MAATAPTRGMAQVATARMRCRVTRPFFVRRGGHIYGTGETFEGGRSQVALLARRRLVDSLEDVPDEAPDLTSLTNAQLAAMCEERGIEVPRRATKAQLLALLEG